MKKEHITPVILIPAGIAGLFLLYYLYSSDSVRSGISQKQYSGSVTGPLTGKLKYVNIISDRRTDCIDFGFYMYFSGEENEDFVIVTDSVRNSFGYIPDNIIGYRFRFDKLMECRVKIEGRRTFLIISPPVSLGQDE